MVGQVGNNIISWFGVVVSAIVGFTQLISNSNPQVLEFSEVKARIGSLCFSVSLVALMASTPLRFCKVFKISIIGVVLACAMLLSASGPPKLFWLPYLSCIRPLFHLTPDKFQDFSKTHLEDVLRFSKSLWEEVVAVVRCLATDGARTVTSVPAMSSSPEVSLTLESTSSPSISAGTQLTT